MTCLYADGQMSENKLQALLSKLWIVPHYWASHVIGVEVVHLAQFGLPSSVPPALWYRYPSLRSAVFVRAFRGCARTFSAWSIVWLRR